MAHSYPFPLRHTPVDHKVLTKLQSQSLIFPMLWSSIAVLVIHVPVCWALVFKLGLGNAGAALAIGISYTLNAIFLGIYMYRSKDCEKTRVTCSGDVLPSIKEFFQFGIPSAAMIWYSLVDL